MTEAYEFEPLEDIDEQDLFLSILYHDARGGNCIRMLLGDGSPKPYVNHFGNRDYHKIGYRSPKYNCYATLNTFRSYKRVSDKVFNYSGIFIDLDGHDYRTVEEMDKAIAKTKKRLRSAFKTGEISPPTMITHTGRGLGIFYILNQSIANCKRSEKSIKYLDRVKSALTARYREILSGDGYLQVDSTVKDSARVCRIPLTMNTKIGRWCRLIHVTHDDDNNIRYYDLKELASDNKLFEKINEVKKQLSARKVVSIDEYRMPFLTMRMQKLELLQDLRGYECSGAREYMAFIYFNAAKQVLGEAPAVVALKQFNNSFNVPLDDGEIEHVIDGTNKNVAPTGDYKGYYRLTDAWIIEKLDITKEENSVCRFGSSKRQIERARIKEEHAKKKSNRNIAIVDYARSHRDVTYSDIAAMFEVSESTVRRVLKDAGIRRYGVEKEPVATISKASSATIKNVQNVAESLLGVPLVVDVEYSTPETDTRFLDLAHRYVELYDSVTIKRREKRQISGQYGFRMSPDGGMDYYMIS